MSLLLEPFGYGYMVNAMWVSALTGGVCAFLSAYLMLKGWSLIGDALSHSIVPGVAGAYMLGLPFSLGAFISGALAAGPTEKVFTARNLQETFGGVLRHFTLAGADLHDDDDTRGITVLTDDERPFVLYDGKGRTGAETGGASGTGGQPEQARQGGKP